MKCWGNVKIFLINTILREINPSLCAPYEKITLEGIIWHANKHGDGKMLKYLRQANNFNKRRAKSKWVEGAKKWTRKSGEYLIERDGKIVSYENS